MTKEVKVHIPVTGSLERKGRASLFHNGPKPGLIPSDIRPDPQALQSSSDGRLQREGLAHGVYPPAPNGKTDIKDGFDPNELGDDLKEVGSPEENPSGRRTTYFENPDKTNLVNIYLGVIKETPLLTASEEVKLAKAYEAGVKATETLATSQQLDGKTRNRLEEDERLGEAARQRMIKSNLRLVVSVARKYMGKGLPLLDLIQEGNIGLGRAVEKFDYRKGFKFSTYATWWIRQGVTKAIGNQARTIRVPIHMIEAIGDVFVASEQLAQALGRDPTPLEIAGHTGITEVKINEILWASRFPESLETLLGIEGEYTLGDFIEDPTQDTAKEGEDGVLVDLMDIAYKLAGLDLRERTVLNARAGREPYKRPYTLIEIGEIFDVSRERIRQIEAEAMRKLRRNPQVGRLLRDFL